MQCKKKKICNICEAPFKMERGCLLEKRCPACRLLKTIKEDIIHGVRIPDHTKQYMDKAKKIANSITSEKKQDIHDKIYNNLEFISEKMGISSEKLRHINRVYTMFDIHSNTNSYYDPNYLEDIYKKQIVDKIYKIWQDKDVSPRNIEVLKLIMQDSFTLKEIGKQMNISQERVRQIESTLIKDIRRCVYKEKEKDLSEYVKFN